MMKDRLLAGGIAGFTGSLVMVVFHLLLNTIPGISLKLFYAASSMFVQEQLLGTLQGNVMGFLVHLICGSVLGLIFVLILDRTGYDYIILKGLGFGLGVWFTSCGILASLLKLPIQDSFIDGVLLMFIHIPFGLTTAWIIKRFARYPISQIQ